MIADTIAHTQRSAALHPDFSKSFRLLQSLDSSNLPDGEAPCAKPNIRLFVKTKPLRTVSAVRPEAAGNTSTSKPHQRRRNIRLDRQRLPENNLAITKDATSNFSIAQPQAGSRRSPENSPCFAHASVGGLIDGFRRQLHPQRPVYHPHSRTASLIAHDWPVSLLIAYNLRCKPIE